MPPSRSGAWRGTGRGPTRRRGRCGSSSRRCHRSGGLCRSGLPWCPFLRGGLLRRRGLRLPGGFLRRLLCLLRRFLRRFLGGLLPGFFLLRFNLFLFCLLFFFLLPFTHLVPPVAAA